MMESQGSTTVAIDIVQLQGSSSICKVPLLIRKVCKNDFEPVVVSIGPYHREKCIEMEKNKWSFLDYILKANPEKPLHDYIELLRELYPLVRRYYPEESQIEISKFVQIFLLDGFFVLMYLYGADWTYYSTNPELEEEPDHEQVNTWNNYFVMHDFLLIENQVPFIIVNRLYELFAGKETISVAPSEKFAMLVEEILSNYPKSIKKHDRPKDFCHLLHLLHTYLRPSMDNDTCIIDNNDQSLNQWYRAVQYNIAGVKIQKREFHENSPHSLLDVAFTDNVLEIPCLQIDDNTTTIFRNLTAFEQTSPQFGNDISAYILFMSELVNSAKDAAALVAKGIIVHQLGSNEEVSNMLKELRDGVDFDYVESYYLKNICRKLGAYYASRMKSWEGLLRRSSYAIRGWD